MKFTPKKLSKKNREMILTVLFMLFLVFDVKLPYTLNSFLNTLFGKGIILATVAYLFVKTSPVLGILSIFVAYKLLDTVKMISYLPSQRKMDEAIASYQPVHDTLEEEIISNIKPHTISTSASPYNAVMSDTHNAERV